MLNQKIKILDISFTLLKKDNFFITNRNKLSHFITINSEILLKLIKIKKLFEIYQRSETTIDSQLIYFYLKKKYPNIEINKLSGSSLVFDIIKNAKDNNRSILLIGSSNKSNIKAVQKIKKNKINVDGFSPLLVNNKLNDTDYTTFITLLKKIKPYYLLVGFGCPKQEYFINNYRGLLDENNVKVAIGIGGSIDFISGFEKRAPKVFIKLGFEWLFRLIQSPQRLYRHLKTYKIFTVFIKDYFFSKKNKSVH